MKHVFYFLFYDINVDKYVRAPRPATKDAVRRHEGAILLDETARVVYEWQLDPDGFLTDGSERFG